MTEATQPDPAGYAAAPPPAYGGAPTAGPIGKVRGTGVCILLFIVTLTIYGWIYYFKTHEEMKQHSGQGLGGLVAFLLSFFGLSFILAFTMPGEIGNLRKRAGLEEKVSAVTGLWATLGALILVGPIVWFVKTNGALNDYWRSQGAQG